MAEHGDAHGDGVLRARRALGWDQASTWVHGDAHGDGVLRAPLVLEYPFTRSTGPVIGAFLTGLRNKLILGIRRPDGSVLCPPLEYDPITSEPLTELVEVADAGEVLTWAWNGAPRLQQPFDGAFAWALIRLDGADTPMLHGVCVSSSSEMSTGMRVRAVWRDERNGHIADIAGFEPMPGPRGAP